MQAHSQTKKTLHHLKPSQLYMISPIHLEILQIREYQLIPRDCNQTVGLHHKMSQVTPKHDERESGSVNNFHSESQLSKYLCIGSITEDKSTLITSTLLDPRETSVNLGATWPKQRQHNLNKFQVFSLRDNSGHDERKEIMSSIAGPAPDSSR